MIPSERTRVNVAVIDGSIRAFAPVHPGCVVIYVGELNFATDIVGDSPEVSFHLAIPAISLLLTDDLSDSVEGAEATPSRVSSTVKGIAHWKVDYILRTFRTALNILAGVWLCSTS